MEYDQSIDCKNVLILLLILVIRTEEVIIKYQKLIHVRTNIHFTSTRMMQEIGFEGYDLNIYVLVLGLSMILV